MCKNRLQAGKNWSRGGPKTKLDFHSNLLTYLGSGSETNVSACCLHPHHSSAVKRIVGSFESQIRTGKTAVDMPLIPLAPLQKSVMASCTGPYGGLCQLDAEKDAPTHTPGLWHAVTSTCIGWL